MRGSCAVDGYLGWIPLTSAELALEFGSTSSSPNEKKKLERLYETDYDAYLKALDSQSNREPENVITCEKYVDSATAYLMELNMRDDIQQGNTDTDKILAEIHFIETSGKLIPYLQMALEEVRVEDWSISGDEDNRPTESFKLKFDRFALRYYAINDKGELGVAHKKGFDNTEDPPQLWAGPWIWKE